MKILLRSFYNRPTLTVARQLLGKTLCRRIGKKILHGRITEVEAYVGRGDKASHASRGMTKRNAIMFGPPGYAYVYLIYGMYWCLNFVTEREGYPAAVLIRAVDLLSRPHLTSPKRRGNPPLLVGEGGGEVANGPGKLCRAFAITGNLNGADLTKREQLWIEDAPLVPRSHIASTPRIGVDYAGAWKKKPYRFLTKKKPAVASVTISIDCGVGSEKPRYASKVASSSLVNGRERHTVAMS